MFTVTTTGAAGFIGALYLGVMAIRTRATLFQAVRVLRWLRHRTATKDAQRRQKGHPRAATQHPHRTARRRTRRTRRRGRLPRLGRRRQSAGGPPRHTPAATR